MQRFRGISSTVFSALLAGLLGLLASAEKHASPSIEFTVVPPGGNGSGIRIDIIEGRVAGAAPGQRIILFAKAAEAWWVQPSASRPFTEVQPDFRWKGFTHPGTAYAALLVDTQYVPPAKVGELPAKGGPILAVATTAAGPAPPPAKEIQYKGYPWRVREAGRAQAGQINFYDPANVSIDSNGLLHLRISRRGDQWTCAEVTLTRGLGYGSYRFVVRDISQLEPAAVFTVGPSAKMAIEMSRWGRPEDKNAQYVITPYTVPANTVRFDVPGGVVTHWMNWEQGRVTFRSFRGEARGTGRNAVAEHVFTSGVKAPGNEGVSLNLYVYESQGLSLKHPVEVIVENFEFLP
jgi:hypothetical protein